MKTKLSKLKEEWNSGNKHGALRIAVTFGRLGEHKTAILQGWNAYNNPGFYKQLGKDPDKLLEEAFAALQEKYSLQLV